MLCGDDDDDDDCDAYIQEHVTLLFTDGVFCDGGQVYAWEG